jgi:DNA-binding NarL/FixJ family response regulator
MRVVAEASSADEELARLEGPVDLAIVDYHLGQGRDGLWLTAELKRQQPARPVLLYSAFADGALAVTALIAGADGLLGKHEIGDELCRVIRRLARGHHHLPAVTPSVADVLRSRLKPRDQAIFGMLLHGIAPAAIAEQLGISSEELHTRRTLMLRAFKPVRPSGGLPAGARPRLTTSDHCAAPIEGRRKRGSDAGSTAPWRPAGRATACRRGWARAPSLDAYRHPWKPTRTHETLTARKTNSRSTDGSQVPYSVGA